MHDDICGIFDAITGLEPSAISSFDILWQPQKEYYMLIFNIEVKFMEGNAMFESKAFVCPYFQCRKTFRKPLMLTDSSKIPRETYYACPHCLSKVDVTTDDTENVHRFSVKVSEGNGLSAVIECPHHFGYLKSLPKDDSIPEKCFACANLIHCSA